MEVDPDVLVTPPLAPLASSSLIQLTDRPLGRRERRSVALHGFAALADGSTAVVKLTDLSYDGCGIETTALLKPGERIHLSVLRLGGISAEVRWCANGHAGLIFDAAQPAQKRRLSRSAERVALTAEVAPAPRPEELPGSPSRRLAARLQGRAGRPRRCRRPGVGQVRRTRAARSQGVLGHRLQGGLEVRQPDPPRGVRPAAGEGKGAGGWGRDFAEVRPELAAA